MIVFISDALNFDWI